jgi:hypothetical protein
MARFGPITDISWCLKKRWPVGGGVFEEATPTAANRPTLRTQEMRRT